MNITNQEIEYRGNGTIHRGYLARDADLKGLLPGVIVIHEWWGVNEYMRRRANMLAGLGYCALAIDMYGEGLQAENPEQAGAAMNAVLEDMDAGTARLETGYQTLLSQPGVDPERTAAIGYCFGGAMALHMARIGLPLKAAVSFHGALGSFHKPSQGEVQAKILVCHGGDDAMVTMADVDAFRKEMDQAQADYEVIIHDEAQHSFSSIKADEDGKKYGIPLGYNARADKDSWDAMTALFDRYF